MHYVEIPHQNHNYGAAAATVNPDVWSFMSQYALHFALSKMTMYYFGSANVTRVLDAATAPSSGAA